MLLGCDIPEEVLKELKPPRFETMVFYTVLKDILLEERKVMPGFLMSILLVDRFQDRFRYLLEYVFPAVESLARVYSVSGKKIYFYYIVHLVHVWRKTGKRLAEIVCSSTRKNNF